jgi:N-acetylmuramoyl-L-alanine amidase/putative methionine-R-sulfoxide reductase with GAF domain
MATIPKEPGIGGKTSLMAASVPAWPLDSGPHSGSSGHSGGHSGSHFGNGDSPQDDGDAEPKPPRLNALQALLAFSALHEQVRRRKALAAQHKAFDAGVLGPEFDEGEQFLLDEVLQLVAERAVAITGADGLAIALAENNEIVLRASAGMVRPDVGARIDRDSAFSGASFRTAQIVICDDTETDSRVNLLACRRLSARSMVAVPLCGRRRVIGLLEAFSTWPFGFNDSDVRNLTLLAELIVSALRPEDEDRFANSAQVAETKLQPLRPLAPTTSSTPVVPLQPLTPPDVAKQADRKTEPRVETPQAVSPSVISSSLVSTPAPAPKTTATPITTAPVQAPPATTPAVPVDLKKVEPQKADAQKPEPAKLDSVKTATAKTEPVKTPAESVATSVSVLAPAKIKSSAVEPPKNELPKNELSSTAAAVESLSEPALTSEAESFGQEAEAPSEDAKPRNRGLVLLVCIAVGLAFAAGIWWWKNSHSGSAMVTDKAAVAQPPAKPDANAASGNASKSQTAASANSASDAISDEAEAVPATPQELAKFPRVTGIRHWSSADSSTVVLDLEDQVQYEAHRLSGPDRIYFDLHDTQLAAELSGKAIEVGDTLLNRIRVAQPVAGMTRVVLETHSDSNFSVSLEPNPYRLVVEVRKPGSNPHGAVNLFPNAEAEKNRLAIVVPPPTKEDLKLRALVPKMRIVVDAGHGGWDLGTVGRRGLLEKDLVLEIAERLGKLLENRLGSEVILTRNDDNYIPLDERAEIANQAQADLFISVHANYSDLPSARGVETYYTNSFSAPGSKEPGSKDSGSKDASGGLIKNVSTASATPNSAAPNSVTPTLSPTDLHERIEQSRRLAASVQRSLYGTLVMENPGLRDRGIKEAGFVVLTGSAMPGILAEVSFVSSPADEQKLRSDGYREQIAEALYRGIARYAAASKSVKVASAGK